MVLYMDICVCLCINVCIVCVCLVILGIEALCMLGTSPANHLIFKYLGKCVLTPFLSVHFLPSKPSAKPSNAGFILLTCICGTRPLHGYDWVDGMVAGAQPPEQILCLPSFSLALPKGRKEPQLTPSHGERAWRSKLPEELPRPSS